MKCRKKRATEEEKVRKDTESGKNVPRRPLHEDFQSETLFAGGNEEKEEKAQEIRSGEAMSGNGFPFSRTRAENNHAIPQSKRQSRRESDLSLRLIETWGP